MASQYVTIVKVAGECGRRLTDQFSRFADRTGTSPRECRVLQITSVADQEQIQRVIDALRHYRSRPPIVFFTQYVDLWSMGDIFGNVFAKHDDGYCAVSLASADVYCYRLPDEGRLLKTLEKNLSSRRKSIADEYKWYWMFLRQAVLAWDSMVNDAAILVVRDVLGGLVEDAEIENSVSVIPEWLREVLPS